MAELREKEQMRQEVLEGLSRPQPVIASKYFYDRRGSVLFERITRQPEYYPTEVERRILRDRVAEWVRELRPASLVEFGAGNADKTRIILDAMARHGGSSYLPTDVSARFLDETAARLDEEYPMLEVHPAVGDMSGRIRLDPPPPQPVWYALLGSTIGNFERDEAIGFLRRVGERMMPDDRILLGFDLVKDRERLEAAYNDAAGVTAEFNLNVLRVLNREVGTDFDPETYQHRAFFNAAEARIEMHLVSRTDQRVHLPSAGTLDLRPGDTIRTEVSYKYDRTRVVDLLQASGLLLDRCDEAPGDPYAVVLARLPAEGR